MWTRVADVTIENLRTCSSSIRCAGAEGGNGEWDDLRDFRAADFVTDTEGTGFVHCAPSHGMDEFELYRDLGMLEQVITYNVMEDGRFRDDLPFFGGKAILKPQWQRGQCQRGVIDKLVEVGGLLARGKIKHSYPHSLALQGARDLSATRRSGLPRLTSRWATGRTRMARPSANGR